MSTPRTPHWVVFDYGEVISRRTTALPDLAEVVGVPDPAAFERAYWAEREAYDRGASDFDYWHAVGARLGVDVDAARAEELTAIDTRGWLHLDDGTVDLIEQLRKAGVPLALLSNAPSSFGRLVEAQPWASWFEHLVFSGDLGIAKPDPEIWLALLDRIGADPADCLFLDDRQTNVDGAAAAGLTPLLWTDAPAATTWLTTQGLLTSP